MEDLLHSGPADLGSKCGDIRKPVEDGFGTSGHVQECEEGEKSSESKSINGNTVLHDLGKDLGGLALLRKHEESSRGSEEELVAGGKGRCKDDGVDDVVKNLDTGDLDYDDEWELSSSSRTLRVGLEKIGV